VRYYTHAAIAALAASLVPGATPALMGVAALGSVLPDLDHPDSFVSGRVWGRSLPARLAVGVAFRHRGFLHTLTAAAVVCAGALFAAPYLHMPHAVPYYLAFGYATHLLGDAFTGGVPLLGPFVRRWYAFAHFGVGGLVEHLVFLVCLGILSRDLLVPMWEIVFGK